MPCFPIFSNFKLIITWSVRKQEAGADTQDIFLFPDNLLHHMNPVKGEGGMLMTEHREILPKKSAVFTITAALNIDRLTWPVKCTSGAVRSVSAPTTVIYLDGGDSAVTQVLTPASGVETAADVFSFF